MSLSLSLYFNERKMNRIFPLLMLVVELSRGRDNRTLFLYKNAHLLYGGETSRMGTICGSCHVLKLFTRAQQSKKSSSVRAGWR